ncbi:8-oxo-dGTP pyrophosphatase MutT, NUDIX family [Chitinophaga jiangningensis]|uniref:GDP-mannose pyrophosphatase n=1 Tax=Chitinophaga jiangningensis TaxID=1419482 RepID=A0A1M7KYG0_9BACT|nr:NUDIX hydrolase [Chitinophaga jiangningensis]SHM70614.1 8-oxo-dGTP pyrophosphatase MutT, NUDIX family [Chitinophaga jiangningensis]
MNNMDWKLLSSEYLHRDTWLTARRDKCETPDGRIVDPYYVLEYNDWVNGLALTEDGQAIMIRQYRHGLKQTLIEIPAGTMDDTDPSPAFAMERELMEETGYAFREIIPLGAVSANPGSTNNLTHMFLATGGVKVKEQELDDNEQIEIELMSIEALQQLILENKLLQSLHVTCVFYALQHMGRLQFK